MGQAKREKVTSINELGLEKALELYRHLDHDLMLAPSQIASLHLTGTFPEEYAEEEERRPLRYWAACHVKGHEKAFSEVPHELLAKYGWDMKELEDCFTMYPKLQMVKKDKRPANILNMPKGQVDWEELMSKYGVSKGMRQGSISDIDNLSLNDLCGFPLLTLEEEREVSRRVRQGDIEAKNIMIKANLRLVVNIANNYAHEFPWVGLMDFTSMGYIGLITGVEKFDPNFGTKFSTYARWWIKHTIRRGIQNYVIVNKPDWFIEQKKIVIERIDDFFKQYGRYPAFDEVIERKLNPTIIQAIEDDLNSKRLPFFEDKYGVRYENAPNSLISTQEDVSNVRVAYETALTAREKFILYYKFFSDKKENLKQISKRLNLTHQRVSQIHAKALKKLKRKLYPYYG
jgi:RNA polymerase sigma factor (sigma-70 family)